ncbi:MAG: glycine betaine ABC transporter substrate-binding protein [Nakamurella sp.]
MRNFRTTTVERRKRRGAAWIASLAVLMTIAGCQVSGTPRADPAAVSALAVASAQTSSATTTEPTTTAPTTTEPTTTAPTTTAPTTTAPTTTAPTTTSAGTGSADATPPSDPESSTAGARSLTVTTLAGQTDLLIGTIWAKALSHRGYRVAVRTSSPDQATTQRALKSGEVDIAASYTGYALGYYQQGGTGSPETVYRKLVAALPAEIGALKAAKADSNYAVVVTAKTAQRYHLSTIADLAKNKKAMSLAIPEFWGRIPEVKNVLFAAYGLSGLATKQSTDVGGPKTVAMLTGGQTTAAVLFTTSPDIDTLHLVVVKDTKYAFVPDFVVPLIHKQTVDLTAQQTLNAVNAKLDTATLRRLSNEVTGEGRSAAAVADEWLASIGMG